MNDQPQDQKILMHQINAVVTTTLFNNIPLTRRSILMQNKDRIGLPMEQYVDAIYSWLKSFGEAISKSGKIYEDDLIPPKGLEIKAIWEQNAEASMTIVTIESNMPLNDPFFGEAMHKFADSLKSRMT